LVVTNMWPSPREPRHGIFVQEQVRDLRARGADVAVIAFDGRSDVLEYVRAIRRVRSAVRNRQFDVVHAHYGLTGLVALFQRSIPVAVTFHGSDTGFKRWQVPISRFVARRAALPIFVSRRGANRLGISDPLIIPAGVDLSMFPLRDRIEARTALGWTDDQLALVFPGDPANPVKNFPLYEAMVEKLRCRGVEVRPVLLTGLDRTGVATLLAGADATVVTSLAEGSPVTVRESLAVGTPVVSVDVGDVADVLSDLPGCRVVDRRAEALADAVMACVSVPPAREHLRQVAERTSGDQVAERLLAAYRSLRQPSRGGGRVVVGWNASDGRVRDLAAVLGADRIHYHRPFGPGLRAKVLRHLVGSAVTVAALVRTRPRTLIVANPPIALPLVAYAYARLSGASYILDSHTGAFGFKDDKWAGRLLQLHRLLARRADLVLVASDDAAGLVREWGGEPLIFFEPPIAQDAVPEAAPAASFRERPVVAWAGMAAADEPLDVLLDVARLLPEFDFDLMVDPRRLPRTFAAAVPRNVRLAGFLHGRAYYRRLGSADVVLALSTASASVMRLGCEAVWLRVPLVVSRSNASLSAFPLAWHVPMDARAIAEGVRAASSRAASDERVTQALLAQEAVVDEQLRRLEQALRHAEASR
jgi:glycosyltransferase involved in cell wall biosynthesis